MSVVVQTVADAPLRLTVSKAVALRHLKTRIQQGLAIRRRNVRYMEDLEEARAAKADWVHTYTDLLRQMFHGDAGIAVADRCNDWVGRVFPDYAEMELFAGQFYEEMDHRLARLRGVAQEVIDMPEQIQLPPRTATEAPGSGKVDLIVPVNVPDAEPLAEVAEAESPEPEPRPAPGGLLVVHDGAANCADAARTFLHDLGIAVRVIPAASKDPKAASAALEQHRDAASFAVVLLGPEDVRNMLPPVTFQLGYLAGRLGQSRVCILCPGDVTHDLSCAIHCLPLDPSNGWHLQLARYLKRAGIEVDLNKLC